MRKLLPGLAALLAALAFSLWALGRLPARVAIHWGISGRPDGWASPGGAAVMLPLVGLGVMALMAFLPRIDPKRANYQLHGSTYFLIVNAVGVFVAVVQAGLIGFALGWPVRMGSLVPIGVGILFIIIGNVLSRLRPNWFAGIRTPWTLSSERVWRETHRVGGYCFMVAGILLAVVGLLLPGSIVPAVIGAGVIAAVIPIVHSYVLWRSERGPEAHP